VTAPAGPPGADDLEQLAAIAAGVLTESEDIFAAGLGAGRHIDKGPGDFATETDLAIEERAGKMLRDRTGIAVHGEELGGPSPEHGVVWVLDPIDGTANFSRRLPLTGMNAALLVDGVPIVGLSWLPLLGERYLAVVGGPVRRNGLPIAPLSPARLGEVIVTVSNVSAYRRSRFPPAFRLALLEAAGRRALRVRVLGSAALDLAWSAAGLIGAAIQFGNHPWDNAPGACLVRAAGGTLADLAAGTYGIGSDSLVAGAPGVVEELLTVIAGLGDPETYRAR
jgi:myo-inositol-1(or 4)-monophosphatase